MPLIYLECPSLLPSHNEPLLMSGSTSFLRLFQLFELSSSTSCIPIDPLYFSTMVADSLVLETDTPKDN